MTIPPTDTRTPYALHVVAHYYDLQVEETFTSVGKRVQIGNSPELDVPVPAGSDFIARCTWAGTQKVQVIDGRGRKHTVTSDCPVTLIVGPVRLVLSLNPRYLLARTGDSRWWEAMPWLSIVLAASLMAGQGGLLAQYRCEWLGGIHPNLDVAMQCVAQQGGGQDMQSSPQLAEYLERLLQEDYAGEDQGVISDKIEREDSERSSDNSYLPAGQDGETAEMGGAEDVGEEIRTPEVEEVAIAEAAPDAEDELLALEETDAETEPVPEPPDVEDNGADGIAEADASDELGEEEDATPPEEDREGWGVQDWYDEEDKRMEEREIEFMTEIAHQRLRIDPNDPDALSILSYYQYLDEDYEAALATYDKYITQLPESSAGYNNKALVYKRQGDYQTEERLYRVALAYSPNDVTTLNNLAVCLAHQGRLEEALTILDQLEALDPGDPYAELHRAKVHAERDDKEQVYFYLRKALQGMSELDTLHHIEFRQDIRLDPSFESMRRDPMFRAILVEYYGKETPLQ
ncbi:MAG: tetratricopeptide (TPR) repeat protein [bacterium]|jgi:tetratricopeptide (TPR) repeat protein